MEKIQQNYQPETEPIPRGLIRTSEDEFYVNFGVDIDKDSQFIDQLLVEISDKKKYTIEDANKIGKQLDIYKNTLNGLDGISSNFLKVKLSKIIDKFEGFTTDSLTDIQNRVLSSKIEDLTINQLADYIYILSNTVNQLQNKQSVEKQILMNKLPKLKNKLLELQRNDVKLSATTITLLDQALQIIDTLEYGKKSENSNNLLNQVTENRIDQAIKNQSEILSNSPTAIYIGIDDYTGTRNDLKGTVNDVNALKNKVENFEKTEEITILNNQATKENILKKISESDKNKPLYMYVASHGINGGIAPADIDLSQNVDDQIISPQEIYSAIGNRKAMIIVDYCYAGDLALGAPENITVISSSDSYSMAAETKMYGNRNTENLRNLEIQPRNEIQSYTNDTVLYRGLASKYLTETDSVFPDLRSFIEEAESQGPSINNANN